MKSKEPKQASGLKKQENTNTQEQSTPEENKIRKKYKIDLLLCLIYAITIQIYFISVNAISKAMPTNTVNICIKVAYIAFILIAIIMFEISYKKGNKKTIISGIEFIILATHTVLLGREVTQASGSKELILVSSYIWPIYYCLKAVIIHTNENRRKLKQISDIIEIVKEEKPVKKVAKKRKK